MKKNKSIKTSYKKNIYCRLIFLTISGKVIERQVNSMNDLFPGHIRVNGEIPEIQPLSEHCEKTADYAAMYLNAIGLAKTAKLIGLLHDAGKAKNSFRDYLVQAEIMGQPVRRGSVNHTFAGCRYLLDRYHKSKDIGFSELTAELLAYACGAHHGLFDCIDEKRQSGFSRRQTDIDVQYREAIDNYTEQCVSEKELDQIFRASVEEITPVIEHILKLGGDTCFYVGLLERTLLSAVIDADRRDTAEFMNNAQFPIFPDGPDRQKMWWDCLAYMEKKLDSFPKETPIQKARRSISDQCAAFAQKTGGIIRLNVPTGGGKTLASLRFALAHAAKYNKSRIVLTSSLLSVLDQNAQVIRDFLPDPSIILEHHSNIVRPEDRDERAAWEMMSQQWSTPIIITTLVQLLNTMFSGKSSCIRRFHSLIDAVVVIDEVQTIPNSKLTLFNLAVNFLSEICGTTVVLCSATQPCLEAASHPLFYEPADMVPKSEEIRKIFCRTKIRDAGSFRLAELPGFIESILPETDSLLVVCNTKKEAEEIYRSITVPGAACFHLSAAMCMVHRQETLQRMKEVLADGREKVICISTQVIEAGVDISFGCVIRLLAGMDSIVQAAGRCNRNGENSRPAPVFVVRCSDEKLKMLQDIQRGQKAAEALLHYFAECPEKLENDLFSDSAIRFYYQKLYSQLNENYQDDIVNGRSVFDLLDKNETFADENCGYSGRFFMQQAFKTAGDLFTVFDENSWDVLVPYKEGRDLRERLIAENESSCWDYKEIDSLVHLAKGYTVSVYDYQKKILTERGAWVELFNGRICVLADGFYDSEVGFTTQERYLEV